MNKLNIVIPMAGLGSRFSKAGYDLPKPLIDVCGKPMIEVVVNNLKPQMPHKFIFICQNEHIKKYGLKELLQRLDDDVEIIGIDGITEGQVCTVLKAEPLIDNDSPLMTANSDQFIDFDINKYLELASNYDGLFLYAHPYYTYKGKKYYVQELVYEEIEGIE